MIDWDPELPKTPDGYYQVRGGIDYAITRSLAAAPFADLLWMETKTANLVDARRFAEAIHAVYPDKMLAYNLSPSFNWDTTGLTDDEMRRFPDELGRLGFVFDFITYGGHQIDGLAAEEFATALRDDGMLALARLQRRFRLLESPYRTPQSLVGGDRLDAALLASSGRTAATRAMGAGSTQHQHLVQTEVPPRLLGEWLAAFAAGGAPAPVPWRGRRSPSGRPVPDPTSSSSPWEAPVTRTMARWSGSRSPRSRIAMGGRCSRSATRRSRRRRPGGRPRSLPTCSCCTAIGPRSCMRSVRARTTLPSSAGSGRSGSSARCARRSDTWR